MLTLRSCERMRKRGTVDVWISLFTASTLIAQWIIARPVAGRSIRDAAGQGPERTVRLKADLLEVRVVVMDSRGRPVDSLKREDFELLENGRPREIVFFSVEGTESERRIGPMEAQAGGARPHAVPRRTIAVVVDTLHLSFSSLVRTKRALREFIEEHISPSDFVAIGPSDGTWGVGFTQDRQVLLRAVDRLVPWDGGLYASRYTPYLAARVVRGDREALRLAGQIVRMEEGVTDPVYVRSKARLILSEAAWRRRAALSLLDALLERMAKAWGQRVLIFISDGFTLMDSSGSPNAGELDRAISRAVRSGVTVYALCARGLEPDRSPGQEELENGLNALAHDTGGRAFFNTNDISAALREILDENRVFYVLGYYPSEEEASRFRRIAVRVKGHPEYTVRAPKGYGPLEARREQIAKTPRQRLFQAIATLFPLGDLRIAVSARVLNEAEGAQLQLLVTLDGSTLNPVERDGRYRFELELAVVVYDEKGRPIRALAHDVEMTLRAGSVERARQDTYPFALRVALEPGFYHVRVGVREPSTERIGTAGSWVEVPDLKRKPLGMSSLSLTEWESQAGVPPPEAFTSAAQWSLVRISERSGLGCHLVIYNAPASLEDLVMRVEIYDHQRRVHQSEWEPIRRWVVGRKRGIEVIKGIRTEDLPPGLYTLQVTVKDLRSRRQERQVAWFEVYPVPEASPKERSQKDAEKRE